MFASTILNSSVANSTLKSVNNGPVLGSHKTREDDRFEMWAMFVTGVAFALGYTLIMGTDSGFLDFCYLFLYFICYMGTSSVSWDSKQPKKAVKTSLILSSLLTVIMLVPFICDMNYNIQVHEQMYGYMIGNKWEYVYNDYINYPQIIGIVFMYIWLICDTIQPLRTLRKMKKSV